MSARPYRAHRPSDALRIAPVDGGDCPVDPVELLGAICARVPLRQPDRFDRERLRCVDAASIPCRDGLRAVDECGDEMGVA